MTKSLDSQINYKKRKFVLNRIDFLGQQQVYFVIFELCSQKGRIFLITP